MFTFVVRRWSQNGKFKFENIFIENTNTFHNWKNKQWHKFFFFFSPHSSTDYTRVTDMSGIFLGNGLTQTQHV